jgi:large subunit ribosomal protein L5
MQTLGVSNVFSVPRISKIVINVGVGEAVANKNAPTLVANQMSALAGQKAIITKARKSVSAFKIREGLPIGVKVTLRGKRKQQFLDKLIHVVIPLLKDFKGVPVSAVDQRGSLNLGFPEQTIFPEIDFDSVDKLRGLQVTIVTTATSHDIGKKFFEMLGVPFTKTN